MDFPCTATLNIPFTTHKRAQTALNSLAVDQELSPKSISKSLTIAPNTNTLQVTFSAVDVRMLRVAMSSFFDMSKVVIETIEEFDI